MLDHNPVAKMLDEPLCATKMPDTLDLADRMRLAINALTNAFCPEEKWALQFVVDFSRRPAVIYPSHVTDAWLNIPPKFIEALTLCRLASGSDYNEEVDRQVLATQLSLIGEDGLTYAPEGFLPQFKVRRDYSEIWGEGRSLIALSILAQIDDSQLWIDIGKKKVDRLLSLSVSKEDFRFFWKGRFYPGDVPPPDADEPRVKNPEGSLGDSNPVFSMIYSVGALGHGAGLFFRVSGYEPALELSRGLAFWALARMFNNEDGRYNFGHFHHGLYALMAVAEYGFAAQDEAVLSRVDACYRWAREMGDPLVGFFAEAMPGSPGYLKRRGNSVEICEVADMVFLALYLTRAGIGDYWDDIDRWTRNMYAEGQMLDAEFLKRIPDSYFVVDPSPMPHFDVRNVAERSVGSFFGWMRANDGLTVNVEEDDLRKLSSLSIMHCCTANGARTLYFVWDSIVTEHDGEIRVNLHLNRISQWLDVESYLPVHGKTVLKIKQARKVAIRMPEWIDAQHVVAQILNRRFTPRIDEGFVKFDGLRPGDEVVLEYPLPERTIYRVIGEIPYKLTMRGASVTGIDPPGEAYPLYTDQPEGGLVEREGFVAPKKIIW